MDTRAFREATRTVSVSYPAPFLVVAFLAFSLVCLCLAVIAHGWLVLVLTGLGAFVAACGVGLGCYALLRRPDLLRSERYSLVTRFIEFVGNHDLDPSLREQLGHTISDLVRDHDRHVGASSFRPPSDKMSEDEHGA
jgi:hypothetical protein